MRHVFFGLPADVAAAQYLYDLIEITFETETWSFKTGDFYGNLYGGERRSGTNSFQLGLAHGIVEKLDVIRRQREAALNGSSGRDLIVVKASVVEEELEKLGLSFVSKGKSAKKYILPDAYEAGQEAGKRFEYVAGIGR